MSPLMKNLIIAALVLFVIVMLFIVWKKFSTVDPATTSTIPTDGSGVGTTTTPKV